MESYGKLYFCKSPVRHCKTQNKETGQTKLKKETEERRNNLELYNITFQSSDKAG